MDLYGAFQLCSIGILAAPVTVKLSSTYFNDRGRNIIFAWTGLILAGLLSLTVEFYRTNSVPCSSDPFGNPLVNSRPGDFPYGNESFTCGYQCSIGPGNPWSPMRAWDSSQNNIYIIPAPFVLTFGTATLLAAACCLPAILSLVTMWNHIAEFNWRQRFFAKEQEKDEEIIEGTNGATTGQMKYLNQNIKKYLKIAVELPVFGAAVLAILVIGEKNFWSKPVNYMTEPIASVGEYQKSCLSYHIAHSLFIRPMGVNRWNWACGSRLIVRDFGQGRRRRRNVTILRPQGTTISSS